MSKSASHTFTKTVKNEAGEKPCRVNGINTLPKHKSRIQTEGEEEACPPAMAALSAQNISVDWNGPPARVILGP